MRKFQIIKILPRQMADIKKEIEDINDFCNRQDAIAEIAGANSLSFEEAENLINQIEGCEL